MNDLIFWDNPIFKPEKPRLNIGDRVYVFNHKDHQYRKVASITKHFFKVEGLPNNFCLKTWRQDIDGFVFIEIYKTEEEFKAEQLLRFLTRQIPKRMTTEALRKLNVRDLKTIAKILKIKSVRHGL